MEIGRRRRPRAAKLRAAGPFTAMQHYPRILFQALELGLWIVIIVALSCGATASAGISK
jgi:hypothetical protein